MNASPSHEINSACRLFNFGAFTAPHCVHRVSSFSSCWKKFRSWPSPLVFSAAQAFCKTMWGFFSAKGLFEAILPHSRKLCVKWAAAAGRWLRPCLGQLQKEHACISLRQPDLAASITGTLSSPSISPSPTMHSFFISP